MSREVQDKVQSLQQQLAGTQAELGSLQQQYSLGEKRLVRASKLISALGDGAKLQTPCSHASTSLLVSTCSQLLLNTVRQDLSPHLFVHICLFVCAQRFALRGLSVRSAARRQLQPDEVARRTSMATQLDKRSGSSKQ